MSRRPLVLNLIPLIDFFLLLALFALLLARWPEALPQRALSVDLPRAEGRQGSGGVLLELDREGRLALNGKPVALKDLAQALSPLLQEGTAVRREADRGVPHGTVVAVLEAVRRAGGEKVEVGVRP